MEGSPLRAHAAWLGLTATLDWLPLPSLVLAPDGTALGANQAWAAFTAAPPEDAHGAGWLGVVDPPERGPLRARLCEAAAVGQAGSGDIRLAGPAGVRWSRWWWQPGLAGRLLVCVADLDGHQPRDDDPGYPDRRRLARFAAPSFLPAGIYAGTDVALDLAGMVVDRLLRAGLTLQSAADAVSGPAADQLRRAVDEQDAIIRDLRSAVFQLQQREYPQN